QGDFYDIDCPDDTGAESPRLEQKNLFFRAVIGCERLKRHIGNLVTIIAGADPPPQPKIMECQAFGPVPRSLQCERPRPRPPHPTVRNGPIYWKCGIKPTEPGCNMV